MAPVPTERIADGVSRLAVPVARISQRNKAEHLGRGQSDLDGGEPLFARVPAGYPNSI
jgi:hypothetical protein